MEELSSSLAADFYSLDFQLKNLIRTPDQLEKYVKLSTSELKAFEKTKSVFKTSITPYYASLMNRIDPNCPIRLQAVPLMEELAPAVYSYEDPLGEDSHMPVPYLVHRYPDRVLFLLTDLCVLYCRYCTRKRFTSQNDRPNKQNLESMIEYIETHTEICDVLISGGDPLFGSHDRLEYVLQRLSKIKHLSFVRIGTRVPVTCPMLITEELCLMLKKYHPLYINTHFNHPREITEHSRRACEMLANAGIPLGNQTVLLKGVNDDPAVIIDLNKKLLSMRVKPYYLLQCDPIVGSEHFRTPISKGIEIIQAMRGKVSGMAIPHYVIDLPEGGGKISLTPEYLQNKNGNEFNFINGQGKEFKYVEI